MSESERSSTKDTHPLEDDLSRVGRRLLDLHKLARIRANRLSLAARVLVAQRSAWSDSLPGDLSAKNQIRSLTHTFSSLTFDVALDSLLSHPACEIFSGFNEQFVRSTLFLDLIARLRLGAFWETGSFLGRTTLLMAAQTDLPIYTCEVNADLYDYVRAILKPFGPRTHTYLEDSRTFLARMVSEHPLARPFIYLDAHWLEDLPLLEELKIITSALTDYVVAIDDFRVPCDEGFGYDVYRRQALDWDFIESTVLGARARPAVFYPGYSSQRETGRRRGFILLASDSFAAELSPYLSHGLLSRFK